MNPCHEAPKAGVGVFASNDEIVRARFRTVTHFVVSDDQVARAVDGVSRTATVADNDVHSFKDHIVADDTDACQFGFQFDDSIQQILVARSLRWLGENPLTSEHVSGKKPQQTNAQEHPDGMSLRRIHLLSLSIQTDRNIGDSTVVAKHQHRLQTCLIHPFVPTLRRLRNQVTCWRTVRSVSQCVSTRLAGAMHLSHPWQ